MSTIKAPYNFVPLSDKVYFPDWADEVSQDIPFEDGESGTIEFRITAQTPIFVRNGHTKEDAENKNEQYKSFSKTSDNKYFIPATSVKGCIRNVLEILSFGKMTQVQEENFGQRDLTDQSYTSRMRNVQCGWMYLEDDNIKIDNCGKPKRVSIKEIDTLLGGKDLYSFISTNDFKDDKDKMARKKYEIIYLKKHKGEKIDTKEGYEKFLNCEDYLIKDDSGTFVLTGQSSKRYYDPEAKKPKVGKDGKKIGCWKGKEKEFVFPNRKIVTLDISDDLFKSFESIHKESEDYKSFWRIKLYKGQKIPVFFIQEGSRIHSIGLSGLYKYPSEQSIYDAIPDDFKNPDKKEDFRMDMADTLFGYTNGDDALKGRVHLGFAMSIGQPTPMQEKTFVSATPHPSYYPLYVKNGYDWNMARTIAGRKRYPVREQANYKNEGTAKMEQVCTMLNKGAVFTETIMFHNLRPIEIGALLSALTFHGMHDKCFHNLGFGKAYGYGKVSISRIKLRNLKSNDIGYYMSLFENEMNGFHNNWLASESVTQLLSMAGGIPKGKERCFDYMHMDIDRNKNEFLIVKNDKTGEERLGSFTSIVGTSVVAESVEGKDFVSFDKEQEEFDQKNAEKQKQEELEKLAKLNSLDLSFLTNSIRFKEGWTSLKNKLEKAGLHLDRESFLKLNENNQKCISVFVERMFARPEKKWQEKGKEFAKQYAIEEKKRVLGE